MADDTKTAIGDLMKQAQGMLAVTPMIGSQCEQFWKAQESVLEEAEAYSRAWFERRHEATRKALEVARELGDTGGSQPTEAMRAVADWQRGSLERMTRDMQEWMDLSARCAACLAGSPAEAERDGNERAKKGAAPKSRSGHTTPL